jgi:biopolymer transport protein ExbB
MQRLAELWLADRAFLETGGDVLVVILFVTFVMWTLIAERYWYLRSGHVRSVADATSMWRLRSDRSSRRAHQVRRLLVSRVSMGLKETLPLVKTLVALCPLLGLLGTVTGMIEVFDVMAIAGNGNPRAMASGVSRATIPTMAGMVASLSGLLISVQLERRVATETDRIADRLAPED